MFRFILVGCGRIAPRHIESLVKLSGGKLVACVDINFSRAQSISQKLGIPAFQNIVDALAWDKFDVAVICTPSGDHANHVIQFIKQKKHVLVEKPMALRLSDAEAMIMAAHQNGVLLGVVKQNRFNPPICAIRSAYDKKRFGRLFMGTVRVRWSRDQAYYNHDTWRGKWATDGGVFANQAIHHIDMLLWFMGEPLSVYAKTNTYLSQIECEDTGVATVHFKSGALGLIEATTATRPSDLEGSPSLLGECGSAEVAGYALNKIRHFNFIEREPDDADVITKYAETPANVYGSGHAQVYKNFIAALNGIEPLLVTGEEAIKSLKLLHAIYVSAEEHREVQLSEAPVSQLGLIQRAPLTLSKNIIELNN